MSSPLRVSIRPAPPRIDSWVVIVTVARGLRSEGPGGSRVNGLTPGPHDSSAGYRRQSHSRVNAAMAALAITLTGGLTTALDH